MSNEPSFRLPNGIVPLDVQDPLTWPVELTRALEYEDHDLSNQLLLSHPILGFHCTKLLAHERQAILTEGLRRLNIELVEHRINDAIRSGALTKNIAGCLLSKNLARERNRCGVIHFVNARSLLRVQSGIHRLLHLWGGEAIYHNHGSRSAVTRALRSLGQPSLVVVGILGSDVLPSRDLVHYFEKMQDGDLQHAEFESHVTETVPPHRIIEIITPSDPKFEALSGYSTWQ